MVNLLHRRVSERKFVTFETAQSSKIWDQYTSEVPEGRRESANLLTIRHVKESDIVSSRSSTVNNANAMILQRCDSFVWIDLPVGDGLIFCLTNKDPNTHDSCMLLEADETWTETTRGISVQYIFIHFARVLRHSIANRSV